MKNPTLLLSALCGIVLLFSCRGSNYSAVSPSVAVETMVYSVSSIPDVVINQYSNGSVSIPVVCQYISGGHEAISIKLSDLPVGASVSPDSIVGVPDFTGTFLLSHHVFTTGTYSVTVTTRGDISGTKTTGFNLKVLPRPCTEGVIGAYAEKSTCYADGNVSYPRSITAGSDITKVIIARDLGGFTADVNCSDGTITVPSQTTSAAPLTVSGTGTYTPSSVIIHWHHKENNAPFGEWDCTSTYRR